MHRGLAVILAAGLVAAIAAPVLAAPKSGCPEPWSRLTVSLAAAAIYPHLLDPTPFPTFDDFLAVVGGDDRDGDGLVCMKEQWGDDLNPKSHWYLVGQASLGEPTHGFIVHDNHAAG